MEETAVVILNYNGKNFLEKFLPTLLQHTAEAQVIIADNASTDDSISYLKTNFPQIKTIQIEKNLGYSGGYNYALKQIEARYYILLNSDIEVTSNWLAPLVSQLKSRENLAACQPKILDYQNRSRFEYAGAAGGFIDHLGYPFCRGRLFDSLEDDHSQYDDPVNIFWATGACLAIKADLFKELGGFDDDFFAHMEEIDLCWRLLRAGYEISYVPSSRVYHVGGGTLQKTNSFKTYLNFRNGLSMLYKNSSGGKVFVRMVLDGLAAFKFLLSGKGSHFLAVFKAHLYFYLNLGGLRKKKRSFIPLEKRKNSEITTLYQHSLVNEYFLKGKKKFSDLSFSD